MPQPTATDVHIDTALTNVSIGYTQEHAAFVADKAFPAVPVDRRSDKFFKYGKEFWFRNEAKKRAPAAESAGGGFGITTDSYACDVWAFHKDVDDQTRANADAALDAETEAARFVTHVMLIGREVEWASTYFGTGIWGTDKTGGTDFPRWDAEGSSDPIEDIKDGRVQVLKTTGFKPNALVVGFEVHEALKKHPLVLERFKYTNATSVTSDMLARLFEVDKYLVAEAVRNTANEGAAGSFDFIAGKHALLCYSAPAPSLLTPSAGYTFVWRGLTRESGIGVAINRFRLEHLKVDRIEGEFAYDMKAVATDLGYFFAGAVA